MELFVLRHPGDLQYEFIDLKGFYVDEAVDKCFQMLLEVEQALNDDICVPNQGNGTDHVYKIVAH